MYILEIILAIIIDDIAVIFEFVGSFAISCIAFIIPGSFFILAEKKFGSPVDY